MIVPDDPIVAQVVSLLEPYKDACNVMMYRHPALQPFPEDIKMAIDTYRSIADNFHKGLAEYLATRPYSIYSCPVEQLEQVYDNG